MTSPNTIARVIAEACRDKGADEFLADPSERLSGGEAGRESSSFANALLARGLAPGDRVALLAGSSVRQAVAFFGCLRAGIVPCCFHVRDIPERLRRTARFINAKAVLFDGAHQELAGQIAGDRALIGFDEGSLYEGPPPGLPDRSPDDPALGLMSSGTTGAPKCVMHTQRTLAVTAAHGRHIYGVSSPGDSAIVVMAPSFAAWIHTVLPFVRMRGRLYFDGRFEPRRFLSALAGEEITVAALVPTAWRMVLAGNPEEFNLSPLRTAFYSGEPGSASLVEELARNICPNVMTAYLASEGGNGAGVAAGMDILAETPSAAGRPVPGAALRIVSPEGGVGREMPAGEPGEICIRGGSLAAGYLDDPALTQAKFADGWWRSGDLGVIDNAGMLSVQGRLDNRINTGGVKVGAEEIEAALMRHPLIRLAGVVGEPDPQWGERIEAHVVLAADCGEETLLREIEADGLLPRHLLPKAIHIRADLPTGPTGKLYRRGLRSDAESEV